MKLKRAPIEVFNLSFLDIISCAFGAVVMLILIAKNGDDGEFRDVAEVSTLIQAIASAEQSVSELQGALSDKKDQLMQAQAQAASNADKSEALEADVERSFNDSQKLTKQLAGAVTTKKNLKRSAVQGKEMNRDDEVGGIPVDSEYVIFVMDTSGSMHSIRNTVLAIFNDVLINHPKVSGFQVISDNGEYAMPSTKGGWIKDSPGKRKAIINLLKNWSGASNSSPVEGIEVALSTYGSKTDSLSLYIFGDDYMGGSYDKVLPKINKLNTNRLTGDKISRIHTVAFRYQKQVKEKYATLMREVSMQNNGTFISINQANFR